MTMSLPTTESNAELTAVRARLEALRCALESQTRHFDFLRQELESSLAAILGMSDLLLESNLGGEQAE